MRKRISALLPVLASCLVQLTTRANDIEPTKEFYTVVYAPKPIVLDGDLSEWSGVPVLADPKFAVPWGSGTNASPNYVLFEEFDGGSWSGPDDQTSAVQIVYDADNVYFGFVVTDDYHENMSGNAWNGDSIQLMIADATRTVPVALYNYALGGYENSQGNLVPDPNLTAQVTVDHQVLPGGNPSPGGDPACNCPTEAVIKRDYAKKKTTYEIKLPKGALGLTTLKGGPQFGLGMAINDGDGALVDGVQYGQAGQEGQKGWGGLGAHSIVLGTGKTPSETALITLAKGNDIEPGKEYYTALRTTNTIVIDGNLSEWAGAPVLADPKFAVPKFSGTNDSPNYVLFEEYQGGTWTGPDDQTSAVQVVYDANNVYFGFVVTDDYHENAANSAWNGDSVQLMIASADRTQQVALYNYALGGVEGALGDVIVMHEAGPGGDLDCNCPTEAIVTRDAVNKKTKYEIKLPAAALGLTAPLTVGMQFGLGMAINDGDELTPGQKGWGGLGAHSIVFGKTPSETALVTLGTTVSGSDRLFLSAINPGVASFSFRATDKGASVVDPASAKLTIDGTVVALTSKKTGDATDFTHTASTPFAPGTTHTYSIEVKDTLGNTVTDQGNFKTTPVKIGLNFGADEPTELDPPGSALLATDVAGVPSVAQANWNNLSGLGDGTTAVPVLSDTGAGTSVTVVWDSNNTWASTGKGEENNQFTGADRILMTGYLDTEAATTSHVTIAGIPDALTAGNGYDLYVYLLGGTPGKGGGYRIVDPAGAVLKDYVLANCNTNPTSYTEVPQNLAAGVHGVGNYIVFKGLKAAAITLEATTVAPQGAGTPPRAPINGVQLVPAAGTVSPPPLAEVSVPADLAISPPTSSGGGSLKGEFWKRTAVSIPSDGATNPTNRIDKLIKGFGTANGTFQAKKLVYLGNDLTHITNWLSSDAGSFVGATNNLDDGAVRLSGYINVAAPGVVKLGTTSDDGSRITIGGIDIINNDGSHGDVTMDTNVNFSAAGLYPIEITYWNGDWTSDGTGANLNHSGNPDPSVHGGANFHLRVAGADVTTAGAAIFHSTAPIVIVPGNLAVSPAVTGGGGGNLNGEYWKRPPVSIPTDGATNPTNRIDALINGFGPADGTFRATKLVYLGNDLTHVTNWLAGDAASFVGDTNNLDDGAVRIRGFINVTNAGTVRLGTTSDDGSRITIAGLDVINNDGSHGDVTMDTNVNFSAAGLYPIEITYWNGDWTSDGTGTNLNHSGSTDPSLHGGANFHLRVAGADVTPTNGAAMFRSTAPVVIVPGDLAVSDPISSGGGSLKGEYWKRPPVSIPTDGATSTTNRIDALIEGFGPADATFNATKLVYLGNDLTHVTNWLAGDAGSFVGDTNNLDDGAVRFSGYINVATAGTVRLGTTSDDGSRITIAGLDVINNDGSHGDATMDTNVNFSAAGLYPIEITYWNGDWTSDGTGTNLNHSGSTDPSLHGGANFHLRVSGADVTTALAAMFHPALITWVVETGGDNEATDTISARWTGQTIPVSVAGEPVPGLVVGQNYSVGFFGNHAPAYVDRAHRYNHASNTVLIPDYLFGGEYIMNGNDNRDNATMTMDVTVSQAVQVYLLIDNRLGDANNTNAPAFDATHMQWVLDQGWAAVMTGNNRTGSATDPDEVGIDESADGTIDNWFSVYTKAFPAGTFQLKQADNTGQNMYGVVVTQPVGTPPDTSLGIKLQGTSVVITVPAGFRLQSTASLSAPVTWTDVPGTSPYTVPLSGAQGYYRGVSP